MMINFIKGFCQINSTQINCKSLGDPSVYNCMDSVYSMGTTNAFFKAKLITVRVLMRLSLYYKKDISIAPKLFT